MSKLRKRKNLNQAYTILNMGMKYSQIKCKEPISNPIHKLTPLLGLICRYHL